ncbi:MAG: YrvL family regulatory protein [Bacillus sp. (in: firmicutes)]
MNGKEEKVFLFSAKNNCLIFCLLSVVVLEFVIGIISITYLGLLSFFGFTYYTYTSMFVFIGLLILFSSLLEVLVFIVRTFLKVIGLSRLQARFIGMLLGLQGMFFIVYFLDEYMMNIDVPVQTEAFFAFSTFLFELLLYSFSNKV